MTTVWELDFYSRPIVDETQKKIWEVLIRESALDIKIQPTDLFCHAEYCASTEVNSVRLRQAIEAAIARAGLRPDKIRFFRQAMANMISVACEELDIPAVLSRRTYALNQWIDDRMATVYPQQAGFQPGTNPSVTFAATAPQPLPDALMGQKWAFVTLEAAAFADWDDWAIGFGESFPLSLASVQPDAKIPGLVIFSPRANPLAGWMSGLELANLDLDEEATRLLLETGASDRWILAALNHPTQRTEAQNFAIAKQHANGVHFIAVQLSPDSDTFAGFWLLKD
jgi:RNA-binding protein Tab2/Atab2